MELRGLGGALWRQKLLVVLILVVTVVAVGVGLRIAPKTWTATAALSADVDPGVDLGRDSPHTLRWRLAERASSRSVAADVQRELSVSRDTDDLRHAIAGTPVPGTALIRITVEDRDPEVAAEIADAVTRVLPQHDSSRAFLFTVVNRATPPETFTSPDPVLALAEGAGLAVLLALGGALARDRRRTTVDHGAEIEELTSAPLLAHVSPPRDPAALPALDPGSAEADVFRHLRAALDAEAGRRPVTKVVVAGVSASEVNVWLGANVAVALAHDGRRVLLVDGRMGERFGRRGPDEPDTAGLYDVLTGTPLEEALSLGPTPRLTVLPSGAWDVQPPAALVESRFAVVVDAATDRFDVVVVLAPPLDASDDARVMAAGGSLLLVVPEGTVTASVLRAHADRVRAVGARLLGVVLVRRRPERGQT